MPAFWVRLEDVNVSTKQDVKKIVEKLAKLKKRFVDKETLMKLQLDILSKAEQEMIRTKEENKKLKEELKWVATELDEVRFGHRLGQGEL